MMRWDDFNDAAPVLEDRLPDAGQSIAPPIAPDADQIACFLSVVFSYCEGLIPVRGFVDQGQGLDTKPHNIWIPADATAPQLLSTYAAWAAREGSAVYVIPGTVPDALPDIICIDPIRNLFDGGPDGEGENDNGAMLFFLQSRVEALRDMVAPEAGIILAHHTKKLSKQQVKEDPFLPLSGASALRGFYTSGMILFRPDEEQTRRELHVELRNGPGLEPMLVDKIGGRWVELDRQGERLVRQEIGRRLDAERIRKQDVILGILLDEAAEGRLYGIMQLAEKFENKVGLGSKHTIRERLSVLATKGFVKFRRDGTEFGLEVVRSRFGYLCVEGMTFGPDIEIADPETGEVTTCARRVLPSHFKCPQSGACLEVENPEIWVYPQGVLDDLTRIIHQEFADVVYPFEISYDFAVESQNPRIRRPHPP